MSVPRTKNYNVNIDANLQDLFTNQVSERGYTS